MKIIFIILLTFLIISCSSENAKETKKQETIENFVMSTTVNSVDTLFMDFFEQFMWDIEFQKSRILFPFKQDSKNIENSKDWKHLSFYSECNYIPTINSDTLSLYDKDVQITIIEMSILNFKEEVATKYKFKNNANKWFLCSSKNISINSVPDFDFIKFLKTFSNDSVFQIHNIIFPLRVLYADPEKDYETVKKIDLKKDWTHIKVIGIKDKLLVLSNIEKENRYRNVFYRGVENGIWVKFTFEKIGDNWKMIKLEDYST